MDTYVRAAVRAPGRRRNARRTDTTTQHDSARDAGELLMSAHTAALVVITLGAAIVNGALGYGFSSITVPLALLFLTNRALNPALVLIEVALNTYVLWVNRAALPAVWRRVVPVVLGLGPGVIAGTLIVSQVSPAWL